MNDCPQHWDATAEEWRHHNQYALWRRHSDAVNLKLLNRWWPESSIETVLKTDLFDEAFSDGLYPFLQHHAKSVVGIDISNTIVNTVSEKFPRIQTEVCDVRDLPFDENSFDMIISNSTLDHFHNAGDIAVAVNELYRVLRPGGKMILTLDNLRNPKIALRQKLPFRFLSYFGVVPYFVGSTLGPQSLQNVVLNVGFSVLETSSVMHCPRVASVALAKLMQKIASDSAQHRYLRYLMSFERLSKLPSHSFTGHFIAVHAAK